MILSKLDEMGVLSRSQLQKIVGVYNVRTMNDILSSMGTYLNHTRMMENVYYLSKQGRELIGSTNIVKKTSQLEHKIMRNDMYIYYDYPTTWEPEKPFIITDGKTREKTKIIADAFFKMDNAHYFIEVDCQQKMIANYRKIDQYAKLFPMYEQKYKVSCMLIFYTNSEFRQKKLTQYAEKNGVEIGVLSRRDLE
ncbi:replication initiation protein [Bacillus phage Pascal]|uniref:Plasmid replication-relaxation protein n=1 Tax=Bacillus phage Pascal TaxID=1540092 RepID=A0A0A0RSY5_9CAUD|nr:replication initiation protein [Bacillus phage Pascal]AIW03661.1 plasmid replication-relaxation protein [Bacillus phage Pascal]